MKNIFKIFILTFFVSIIVSCTNEKESFASAEGLNAKVDTSVTSTSILTEVTKANNFAKITWDLANNGTPSESTYILQITDKDSDPEFKEPIDYNGAGIIVSPSERIATITVDEMNSLMNLLPSFKCTEMNISVRIKSTLGVNPTSSFIQYSNVLDYKITGYSKSIPLLAFSSSSNNLSNAATLKSSDFKNLSNFEGYFYLQAGNYNFYQPNGCGAYSTPTIYGGSGNTLSINGLPINILNTGYYYIKANLVANTYSIKQYTSFGVIGTGTRGTVSFNNFCPMSDITNTNIWKITMDLIPGRKIKFRSSLWSGAPVIPGIIVLIPVPTSGPLTVQNPAFIPNANSAVLNTFGKSAVPGELVYEDTSTPATITASEISVPGTYVNDIIRKSYDISVDVSNPRAYTYTIKEN